MTIFKNDSFSAFMQSVSPESLKTQVALSLGKMIAVVDFFPSDEEIE